MTIKIERKYFPESIESVRISLMNIGAIRQGISFETDISFLKDVVVSAKNDSSEENYNKQIKIIKKLLEGDSVYSRWRTIETADGISQFFTINKLVECSSGFKKKKEIEFFVPMRFEEFKNILNKAGCVENFRYEKIREDWKLDDVIISLDTVPFIKVVELEGESDKIVEVEKQLNLSANELSCDSYYELYRKHCILDNKEIGKSVSFQEPNRTQLRRWVLQDW